MRLPPRSEDANNSCQSSGNTIPAHRPVAGACRLAGPPGFLFVVSSSNRKHKFGNVKYGSRQRGITPCALSSVWIFAFGSPGWDQDGFFLFNPESDQYTVLFRRQQSILKIFVSYKLPQQELKMVSVRVWDQKWGLKKRNRRQMGFLEAHIFPANIFITPHLMGGGGILSRPFTLFITFFPPGIGISKSE